MPEEGRLNRFELQKDLEKLGSLSTCAGSVFWRRLGLRVCCQVRVRGEEEQALGTEPDQGRS